MTPEEYTTFENLSPVKHEYFNGEVFAMAGARPEHSFVATACTAALSLLSRRKGGCQAFNSDQRIYIPATGLYTYADGGVVCGRLELHGDGMCMLNPVLLLEVLSPSTRDYDTGAKLEHYWQIPSLRHVLLVDPATRTVWHHARPAGGGPWSARELHDGALDLADLGGEIPLAEIYPLEA